MVNVKLRCIVESLKKYHHHEMKSFLSLSFLILMYFEIN